MHDNVDAAYGELTSMVPSFQDPAEVPLRATEQIIRLR